MQWEFRRQKSEKGVRKCTYLCVFRCSNHISSRMLEWLPPLPDTGCRGVSVVWPGTPCLASYPVACGCAVPSVAFISFLLARSAHLQICIFEIPGSAVAPSSSRFILGTHGPIAMPSPPPAKKRKTASGSAAVTGTHRTTRSQRPGLGIEIIAKVTTFANYDDGDVMNIYLPGRRSEGVRRNPLHLPPQQHGVPRALPENIYRPLY